MKLRGSDMFTWRTAVVRKVAVVYAAERGYVAPTGSGSDRGVPGMRAATPRRYGQPMFGLSKPLTSASVRPRFDQVL